MTKKTQRPATQTTTSSPQKSPSTAQTQLSSVWTNITLTTLVVMVGIFLWSQYLCFKAFARLAVTMNQGCSCVTHHRPTAPDSPARPQPIPDPAASEASPSLSGELATN